MLELGMGLCEQAWNLLSREQKNHNEPNDDLNNLCLYTV